MLDQIIFTVDCYSVTLKILSINDLSLLSTAFFRRSGRAGLSNDIHERLQYMPLYWPPYPYSVLKDLSQWMHLFSSHQCMFSYVLQDFNSTGKLYHNGYILWFFFIVCAFMCLLRCLLCEKALSQLLQESFSEKALLQWLHWNAFFSCFAVIYHNGHFFRVFFIMCF